MTSPEHDNPLGDFLRARRERTSPDQAGMLLYGGNRRVSGLRREEVALLAGVSPSYYTRIEQGQSRGASSQVLNAIADALRFDATEREHLRRIANRDPRPHASRRRPAAATDPGLQETLGALTEVPALIIGHRNDVLAWNPLGHALLAGHLNYTAPETPRTRPNLTRMTFLDPQARSLYVDRRAKTRAVVGNLRLTAARYPDDRELTELIGELTLHSPEFTSLWNDHTVQPCGTATYKLQHPFIGQVTIRQQSLKSGDHTDQTLIVNTAPHGSADAEAIALLHHTQPDTHSYAG